MTGSAWPGRLATLLPGAAAWARPGDRVTGVAPWALVSSALSPLLLVAGWLAADAVQPPSYSPVRQTISVLAGHGGTDRWIMTTALFAVGCCHLVTVLGVPGLHRSARLTLLIAGVAAIGVAACPEPAHGSTSQHIAFTVIGAIVIAIWPAFTAVGRRPRPAVAGVRCAAAATVTFLGLLAWLALETRGGAQLGLAERTSSAIETAWPFVVALALRNV